MYANSTSNSQAVSQARETQRPRNEPVGSSSWYAKMATGWGAALDRQADKTVALSEEMAKGFDSPGAALQVSAAAHQLSFLSTAAATTSNSIAQALETLGKKQ